jgi:hypothetical protein
VSLPGVGRRSRPRGGEPSGVAGPVVRGSHQGGVRQGGAWGQARRAGRWGWPTVEGLSPYCPEQAAAADAFQRPLRSRCQARLSRSVRCQRHYEDRSLQCTMLLSRASVASHG